MRVALWVTELARRFWDAAGDPGPYPRELQPAIVRGLPLTTIALPALSVNVVRSWLRQRDWPCPCRSENRALRACLVAHRERGFIFVDDDDPAAEQHFSIAHELAHYLRDYWQPRQHAQQHLNDNIMEVFDGERPPTENERLQAAIAGIPLGFHWHLMTRGKSSALSSEEVIAAERDADLLAFELMAPAEALASRLPKKLTTEAVRAQVIDMLQIEFGFPFKPAQSYADLLYPPVITDPLLDHLRKNI